MRALEFRAWDIKRKTYDHEEILLSPNGDILASRWQELREPESVYILEAFTGLKDKNGHKIYNGDIVSEEFEYGGEKTKTIWQVRWCDDEYAFELHYVSGFEVDDCSLVAGDEEDYEVIGNIHENKELLEIKDVD